MCKRKWRAEPAERCLVVVCGFAIVRTGERGLGVQAEEGRLGPRWWRKSQRTFFHPSQRLLGDRDEMRQMGDKKSR